MTDDVLLYLFFSQPGKPAKHKEQNNNAENEIAARTQLLIKASGNQPTVYSFYFHSGPTCEWVMYFHSQSSSSILAFNISRLFGAYELCSSCTHLLKLVRLIGDALEKVKMQWTEWRPFDRHRRQFHPVNAAAAASLGQLLYSGDLCRRWRFF